MISNITEIRVRYADTDKMQFVYNGKYLEYFEVGRCELLRAYGLPYSEIENRGYQLPVISAHLDYLNSAGYDDLLFIEASIEKLFSAKLKIYYKITKEEETLVAKGYTEHVFIKEATKKACKPPEFFLKHFLNK